jgi:polar amino acid transport system permease protein
MTWDWDYVRSIVGPLMTGLGVTVEATLIGTAIAVVLGLALTLGRRSRRRWVSLPVAALVELVRSTPLLILLYALFYVLPDAHITLSAFTTGMIGLGLYFSSYTSEVYRAGIEGVPRGQWEAARALGLSSRRTWVGVILPQAIPAVLPSLANQMIAMFKDSALLSTVTIIELLATAQNLGAYSYRYLEPFTLVGLFYFVVSYISSTGVRRLEARLARR